MAKSFFPEYFQSINQTVLALNSKILVQVAELVKTVSANSKKIILVGNGGGGAMASHVAGDFTKAAQMGAGNF